MTIDKIFLAQYIGCGCFIRVYNQCLAFVKRANRPAWLKEGTLYELVEYNEGTDGVIFRVLGES